MCFWLEYTKNKIKVVKYLTFLNKKCIPQSPLPPTTTHAQP